LEKTPKKGEKSELLEIYEKKRRTSRLKNMENRT